MTNGKKKTPADEMLEKAEKIIRNFFTLGWCDQTIKESSDFIAELDQAKKVDSNQVKG